MALEILFPGVLRLREVFPKSLVDGEEGSLRAGRAKNVRPVNRTS
jgi:hypothetical protein